jgi:isopentenyldiphosphate isomerase
MLRAQNWREDRVWFHDVADRRRSLPANWTSTVAEDPFNVVATGRAAFRVGELLELVRLIGERKP